MTEEFMDSVKKDIAMNYSLWAEKQKEKVEKENDIIREQNKRIENINELLKDENVRKFAELIRYEKEEPVKYLEDHTSLFDYLYRANLSEDCNEYDRYISFYLNYILENDKYPIFCYLGSETPIVSPITGKKYRNYSDRYWSLQRSGYSFVVSDESEDGKNREEFRNKYADSIIYPPEGLNFLDCPWLFRRIRAEFTDEALRTNQGEAKKLVLEKYGRR